MEIVNTAPLELLNATSGFLKINNSKLVDLNKMIELLNVRKDIITSSEEKLSDFENNERAILLLKTNMELANLHRKKIDFDNEMQKYIDGASEVITEMIDKWESLIVKANKEARTNKDLAKILESMDEKLFAENIDVKINYYVQIKSMVYPNQMKPMSVVK